MDILPGGLRAPWLDSFEFKDCEDFWRKLFRHAPTLRVAADSIAQRTGRRAGRAEATGYRATGL